MKAYLELVGTSLAFLALAMAAMWLAPAKADPLSDFFDAIFEQHARLPPHNAHWRRINVRPQPWAVATLGTAANRRAAGVGPVQSMLASYYGGGERLNKRTASGAVFQPRALTAAHRTLPFGTKLLVSRGARAVVVTVNDRGPAARTGRSLDVSRGAAVRLAMLEVGVARVNVQVLR